MGIVLAVKKKNVICIASDSMSVSGGSRKQMASHVINSEKIIQCGSSYIGTAGHPLWPLVLKSYFKRKKPQLSSKEAIFQELFKMHPVLKEEYCLNAATEEDDPFESSRFESLIVNGHGIFKTYELRSVQKFIQFAAIGSGAQYALGALYALYDRLNSAEEIAKSAIDAAAEFDDSSGLPGFFHTVKAL